MPDSLMPKRPAIARALLELLADGQVHDDEEICESLIRRFGVDESRLPIIKKTGRPKFRNEIDWVKVSLGEGKIRQISERHYQILPVGLAAVNKPAPGEPHLDLL
jgi:restriction endonuclease Mrr